MKDMISKKFIDIALSIDNIIGEGNLIDAKFISAKDYNVYENTSEVLKKIDELRTLLNSAEDVFPFFKKTYIEKHLISLELQLRIFSFPKEFTNNYIETCEKLLDIQLIDPPYEKIIHLHEEIDLLLQAKHRSGTLSQRVQAWRNSNKCLPVEYLDKVKKTASIFGDQSIKEILPVFFKSEEIVSIKNKNNLELAITDTSENWSAYNYYQGNYTGHVAFNSAGTFESTNINSFISHEAYPGHHFSALIKEYYSKEILKDDYLALQFLNTPSSLVEEGIADCGLQILGIKSTEADEMLSFLLDELNASVIYCVAYNLFVKNSSDQDAMAFLKSNKLMEDDAQVLRGFRFIKSWKYYVPSYKLGRDFMRLQYLRSANKMELYKLLYLCPVPSIINSYVEKI